MKSKTIKDYPRNETDYQFNIGKRIMDQEYLAELNKYPGQLSKLIETEINNFNNSLAKRLINN